MLDPVFMPDSTNNGVSGLSAFCLKFKNRFLISHSHFSIIFLSNAYRFNSSFSVHNWSPEF